MNLVIPKVAFIEIALDTIKRRGHDVTEQEIAQFRLLNRDQLAGVLEYFDHEVPEGFWPGKGVEGSKPADPVGDAMCAGYLLGLETARAIMPSMPAPQLEKVAPEDQHPDLLRELRLPVNPVPGQDHIAHHNANHAGLSPRELHAMQARENLKQAEAAKLEQEKEALAATAKGRLGQYDAEYPGHPEGAESLEPQVGVLAGGMKGSGKPHQPIVPEVPHSAENDFNIE